MRSQQAFTLLEITIVLVIMTVLAVSALPVFDFFRERAQNEIVLEQLLGTIRLAKMSAITRRKSIVLCLTDNQTACSGREGSGYLLFASERDSETPASSLAIILQSQVQFQHTRLHWRAFPVHRNYLLFLPDGWPRNENGSFWFCRKHAVLWVVFISKTGRTRTVYPDPGGVVRDARGKPLDCGSGITSTRLSRRVRLHFFENWNKE